MKSVYCRRFASIIGICRACRLVIAASRPGTALPERPPRSMSTTPHVQGLQAKLEERFGLKRFRAGQAEAIGAAIAGRDVLVVMPTGSGKSLCYQLPALESKGTTVVVSPLIAL